MPCKVVGKFFKGPESGRKLPSALTVPNGTLRTNRQLAANHATTNLTMMARFAVKCKNFSQAFSILFRPRIMNFQYLTYILLYNHFELKRI